MERTAFINRINLDCCNYCVSRFFHTFNFTIPLPRVLAICSNIFLNCKKLITTMPADNSIFMKITLKLFPVLFQYIPPKVFCIQYAISSDSCLSNSLYISSSTHTNNQVLCMLGRSSETLILTAFPPGVIMTSSPALRSQIQKWSPLSIRLIRGDQSRDGQRFLWRWLSPDRILFPRHPSPGKRIQRGGPDLQDRSPCPC